MENLERSELLAEIKKCSLIAVNGTAYFGTVTEDDGKVQIKNAITVKSSDFQEIVKTYIKAKLTNKFENIELGGIVGTSRTEITEEQVEDAEIVVIQSCRIANMAVNKLMADSI